MNLIMLSATNRNKQHKTNKITRIKNNTKRVESEHEFECNDPEPHFPLIRMKTIAYFVRDSLLFRLQDILSSCSLALPFNDFSLHALVALGFLLFFLRFDLIQPALEQAFAGVSVDFHFYYTRNNNIKPSHDGNHDYVPFFFISLLSLW